jgi:hypothetical protein
MLFDLKSLIKYLLQGLAVAVAIYFLLRDRIQTQEILTVALAAAAAYAILDTFAPVAGLGARLGTGIGLGMSLIPEGFEGEEEDY